MPYGPPGGVISCASEGANPIQSELAEAFFWGLVAGSPLLLGCWMALTRTVGRQTLGVITACGAGALLSAVAYELVLEAAESDASRAWGALGFFVGSLTFFVADLLITRRPGRRDEETSSANAARGIVLGSVLDGVPESIVLGMSVAGGAGVSVAMLVSILLSNFPEGMAASDGLAKAGYPRRSIFLGWGAMTIASGLFAAIGYTLADAAPDFVAFTLSFAGGAVITMVADTMLPKAYEESGLMTGPAVALGFGVAFLVHLTSFEL